MWDKLVFALMDLAAHIGRRRWSSQQYDLRLLVIDGFAFHGVMPDGWRPGRYI